MLPNWLFKCFGFYIVFQFNFVSQVCFISFFGCKLGDCEALTFVYASSSVKGNTAIIEEYRGVWKQVVVRVIKAQSKRIQFSVQARRLVSCQKSDLRTETKKGFQTMPRMWRGLAIFLYQDLITREISPTQWIMSTNHHTTLVS